MQKKFYSLCWLLLFVIHLSIAAPQNSRQFHHPEALINSLKNDPHAAEKIYDEFCAVCHAQNPDIPLGAPRFQNPSDWDWRIKRGKEVMLKNTYNGITNMPPRGGCFECSDELLEQVTDYMLPKKGSSPTPSRG